MYAELHCHSYFSLLDGASSPEALVAEAAALKLPALALTDHDAVYGAVRFEQAARAQGIKPIFGAELTLQEAGHLTMLVENARGWANLCWLISRGRACAPKGEASLPLADLAGHTDGLIALSGCRDGAIARAVRRGNWRKAQQVGGLFRELFGKASFWIELQNHQLPGTAQQLYKLVILARGLGVGYVATNNVHYATPAERALQDVLVCIRHRSTLDDSSALRRPNSEYRLKGADDMRRLFAAYPGALRNSLVIAERCHFGLTAGLQELPDYPLPEGETAADLLRVLCEAALPRRAGERTEHAQKLLDHELAIIARAGLSNYFLIVYDIVRFARENGTRCQGRGSSANSLVAYLLGISPINPLAHDLVFERFLSDEHRSVPDIDIDFQADRREEVIQYVYERYGRDHAAMACTFVTFRARSAIREVGQALGLPPDVIDQAARNSHARNPGGLSAAGSLGTAIQQVVSPERWQQFEQLCGQIRGLPRHLGLHNGGMILTREPLAERLPTEPATMPGRSVVQWDKDALEDAGLIKIDLLGLRMLSVIAEAIRHVELRTQQPLALDLLPTDDPEVYAMICAADTVGVFQVESRAQAQVLPRLRPTRFNDLIISISLIRPGPIQGNMVHPYLRRRLGEEPVRYVHALLEPALAETLGVILFQEQVLKVARDLGRLTAGQGERLRRALGKQDVLELARFEAAFLDGAQQNGAPREVAEAVFGQIKAFGGYSFPKSHAAAFAVLVYQSAWLKRHHPLAFYVALLNHQPMGFWSPAVLVNDARQHGIRVLSVDLERSEATCTHEGEAIRLGLSYVNGLGDLAASHILAARAEGQFRDLADFCRRTGVARTLVERLILVGAMDTWGIPRRQLIWQLGELLTEPGMLDLALVPSEVELPMLERLERIEAEYLILGLSPGDHLMGLLRAQLDAQGVLTSADLNQRRAGEQVCVAGLVAVHQAPPTAKGHHFVTLEDEDGLINVIFRPAVYASVEEIVTTEPLLRIWGVLQRQDGALSVLAQRAVSLYV